MGKPAALAGALVSLSLTGCVAPLMMAPAMLSMGASTAARSAMTRQQQATATTNSPMKFEPFWAKKKTDDTSQTATR
jgi:hypothetical protein